MKPGLWDTWVATINQGLRNRLLAPDEALAKLEEARLKGRWATAIGSGDGAVPAPPARARSSPQ